MNNYKKSGKDKISNSEKLKKVRKNLDDTLNDILYDNKYILLSPIGCLIEYVDKDQDN